MPTALEIEIQSLLKRHGDPSLVADELVRRWERNVFSPEEQTTCAQFLLACGFLPSLFAQVERLLHEGARLPWAQLAEALGRSGVDVTAMDIDALVAGAVEQDSLDKLATSRAFDQVTDRLRLHRHATRRKLVHGHAQRRQTILDKIAFFRANRMIEEEARAIAEGRSLFPGDTEFEAADESHELRWAREIVQNATSVAEPTRDDLLMKVSRLSPEQLSAKAAIVERAKELVKNDRRLAYDLAVTLHFMDFNAEAVELLEGITDNPAADWLRLELLIQARQYVSVLDEAARLELRYASEPEAAFAAVYARARALWGLGQSEMAINLLESLIQIRPGYKSAYSLLLDWTGGAG